MGGRAARGFWKERALIPHPPKSLCTTTPSQHLSPLGWPSPLTLRMFPTVLGTTTQDRLLQAQEDPGYREGTSPG